VHVLVCVHARALGVCVCVCVWVPRFCTSRRALHRREAGTEERCARHRGDEVSVSPTRTPRCPMLPTLRYRVQVYVSPKLLRASRKMHFFSQTAPFHCEGVRKQSCWNPSSFFLCAFPASHRGGPDIRLTHTLPGLLCRAPTHT